MPAPSTRAGRYVRQHAGYRAFDPAPLPPDPPLALDARLQRQLSEADLALGRLDGMLRAMPGADAFVDMQVRREAVLSSRIEGTRARLDDLLAYELDRNQAGLAPDVREVAQAAEAIRHTAARLGDLPLSLRLIREGHERLTRGLGGQELTPGEFRRSQNWVGRPGSTLLTASYVPPPVYEMQQALDNLERFIHERPQLPALAEAALVHAQFEIIHPFLDGNGRVGRLLLGLFLAHRGVLAHPALVLSAYFAAYQAEYEARLTGVHDDGDWEGWLGYVLDGVAATAGQSVWLAEQATARRARHRALVARRGGGDAAQSVLDHLAGQPLTSAAHLAAALKLPPDDVAQAVTHLLALGLLEEAGRRDGETRLRYGPWTDLFRD